MRLQSQMEIFKLRKKAKSSLLVFLNKPRSLPSSLVSHYVQRLNYAFGIFEFTIGTLLVCRYSVGTFSTASYLAVFILYGFFTSTCLKESNDEILWTDIFIHQLSMNGSGNRLVTGGQFLKSGAMELYNNKQCERQYNVSDVCTVFN